MRITAFLSTLLLALIMLSAPPASSAQIGITVAFGPPALPVYEQPICPGDGYIWTPGYWAWDPDDQDYYWVPGTWIEAPEVGFLWTPPWWGWEGGAFLFHEGWWGPHIGFYGGINYGFGYFGTGFVGGRWDGGHFFYNREVTNINVVNIHNVYSEHVNVTVNHVSYNGGNGGIVAHASAEDERYASERHVGPVAAQTQHFNAARGNRELHASVNQGRPSIAATARPGEFSGHDVMAAKEAGAPYHPPANRGNAAPPREGNNGARPGGESGGGKSFTHPNELPPIEHPAAPNTGNAKQDQKYQKQQENLYNKQNQERQQLQQKQEQEHQQAQQRNANDAAKQQMEQRHQQQTQQLQQRHTQQAQHLQQRQAPPPSKR